MSSRNRIRTLAGAALLALAPLSALAAGITAPPCDDWGVTARVSQRFAYGERHVGDRLTITGIADHRQTRLDDHGPSVIHRRYCEARATLSDGTRPKLYYVIETGGTLTGCGWNVYYCVAGHDPYHVNDGWCRVVRPQ